MLGIHSYVKYAGDKETRGTIIGETPVKWIVEWWNPNWKETFTSRADKTHPSLIEIMMGDEPVKNVNGKMMQESEFLKAA